MGGEEEGGRREEGLVHSACSDLSQPLKSVPVTHNRSPPGYFLSQLVGDLHTSDGGEEMARFNR